MSRLQVIIGILITSLAAWAAEPNCNDIILTKGPLARTKNLYPVIGAKNVNLNDGETDLSHKSTKAMVIQNNHPIRTQCFGTCYLEAEVSGLETQLQVKHPDAYVLRSHLILQTLAQRYSSQMDRVQTKKEKQWGFWPKTSYFSDLVSGGWTGALLYNNREVSIIYTDDIGRAQEVDNEITMYFNQELEKWINEDILNRTTALDADDTERLKAKLFQWDKYLTKTINEKLGANVNRYRINQIESSFLEHRLPHSYDPEIDGVDPDYDVDTLADDVETLLVAGKSVLLSYAVPYYAPIKSIKKPIRFLNRLRLSRFDLRSGLSRATPRLIEGYHAVQLIGVERDREGNFLGFIVKDSNGTKSKYVGNPRLTRSYLIDYFYRYHVMPNYQLTPYAPRR